ncbi:nitroreductase [Oceanidesulfovibrio marinus]|uniref:Nitroreductase n=2 Tax=Oceanidesulfovibrio marinus TaxID=370038 RepID=A0A6P1ZNQ8_9BACT|nr:nitroreductase [Oceanidesulfovibrio marinus]
MTATIARKQSDLPGAVTTVIDQDACIGCGMCVRVCPSKTLTMVDGKAAVTGETSLQCGHCEAICPVGAVRVGALDRELESFAAFQAERQWLKPGAGGPEEVKRLVRLMASRRSCRNYTDEPVSRETLDDLIKIAVTAPSGTNSQRWTFTVLPTRDAVFKLGDRLAQFFAKLNAMAEKPWMRAGLKLVGQGELDEYYHSYYHAVEGALEEWNEQGVDRLFHGAPAAILVGVSPGASCPQEDCLLATQNMILGAHALGLGTCLIGYAVAAMKEDPGIARDLGLPKGEVVHAVVAVGHPDEKYRTVSGRRTPLVRMVE